MEAIELLESTVFMLANIMLVALIVGGIKHANHD
jgi:hypothetical protein